MGKVASLVNDNKQNPRCISKLDLKDQKLPIFKGKSNKSSIAFPGYMPFKKA